ncbi:MAG TPA: capsule biosynthesis protein [Maribacter sp.]|nr:capsule biosynthesis protein [Maribacter sp.]
MIKIFTKHPNERGMSYGQHLVHALGNSLRLACCSLVLFIHSFLPFIWKDYVSSRLEMKDG